MGDRPAQLDAAIRSARGQKGVDVEIVLVVNGGDPDRSLADVVVEPGENLGIPGGRNAGAAVATGEFLCFLDDDGELLGDSVFALQLGAGVLVGIPWTTVLMALHAVLFALVLRSSTNKVESRGRSTFHFARMADGNAPPRFPSYTVSTPLSPPLRFTPALANRHRRQPNCSPTSWGSK